MSRIYTRGTAIERAVERIIIQTDGCWTWQGSHVPAGYAHMNIGDGRFGHAHRVTYEHFIGPIPHGLELDHLCGNRGCVNPWHLEPVTHAENARRGESPEFRAHRNGTCVRGHDASESTRRRSNGTVVYCRACRRDARAAQRKAA